MKVRSPLFVSVWVVFVVCLGLGARASAQQIEVGFAERQQLSLVVPKFSDRDVAGAITTLDRLLASEKDPGKRAAQADTVLWNFARHLQTGRLSTAQEALVTRHLDALAKTNPAQAASFAKASGMVTALSVGKTAPDIVGKDLDGVEFKLSDYRGKVVVMMFSAEWCGICRTVYPYEKLMLDLYKNWPFAILGVETGSTPAAMKQVKTEAGLSYRSWWDNDGSGTKGPIATAWNVGGYPTIYVIDRQGVIRFVDVRYEDLLKAVRQLLSEDVPLVARTGANAGN